MPLTRPADPFGLLADDGEHSRVAWCHRDGGKYQWHGVSVERIRCDRVLHEALTARADPLHLALVFGLSYCTASKYTLIACDLLAGQPAGGGRGAARRSRPATAQFAGWIWGRQLALTIRV